MPVRSTTEGAEERPEAAATADVPGPPALQSGPEQASDACRTSQDEREDTTVLEALATAQTRIATRDRGATAVEYVLLVDLVMAVIVAVVATLGHRVTGAVSCFDAGAS
ncbi:MAG: hypothetical protein M3171_08030 [Actinomycetota bacterium]|nr:hypothetical protein [Actinomycetota bacterium]